MLFKDKVNFKLPGGGGFEAHQDAQAGWNEYASQFITFALAVDRTTRENGCLELAHWKHRPRADRRALVPAQRREPRRRRVRVRTRWSPATSCSSTPICRIARHRTRTRERRRVLYVTYNRASEGDHRARYYADKHANYPPDCEREPGKQYAYRV